MPAAERDGADSGTPTTSAYHGATMGVRASRQAARGRQSAVVTSLRYPLRTCFLHPARSFVQHMYMCAMLGGRAATAPFGRHVEMKTKEKAPIANYSEAHRVLKHD